MSKSFEALPELQAGVEVSRAFRIAKAVSELAAAMINAGDSVKGVSQLIVMAVATGAAMGGRIAGVDAETVKADLIAALNYSVDMTYAPDAELPPNPVPLVYAKAEG
jgi:hypothetical protein